MTEGCKHDWKIWGVNNTTDMNIMCQCAKCGEVVDRELIPFNGHLPMGIFQGQGGYSWVCSPECPKCNPKGRDASKELEKEQSLQDGELESK